jgi:rod shape-determining protein MreC
MLFPSINKYKRWLLSLLVCLLLLNLYFHTSFDGNLDARGRWLDGVFAKTFTPLQLLVDGTGELVFEGAHTLQRLWSVDQENQKLVREMDAQKLLLHQLEELKRENDRLRGLLHFRAKEKVKFVVSKIVSRDISLYFRTIKIDRGMDDGVQKGMAVVSPQGVIGRILSAEDSTATVLLITDVNSRVDAIVQRSRQQVIVGGSPDGDLNLRFLPRRQDIRQGDLLVTSGYGETFPSGFKIGRVIGLGQDPNRILDQAELEPVVNFESLEEVLVVGRR